MLAFESHLEPEEELKHWAVGVVRPRLLPILPLFLLAVVPGLIARWWKTRKYCAGVTASRLILLQYRSRLEVEECRSYPLWNLPRHRIRRWFSAATLVLEDPKEPLKIRFRHHQAPNSPANVEGILTSVERPPGDPASPSPKDTRPDLFAALNDDLNLVLGDFASRFLDTPLVGRTDPRPHLVLGPGKREDAYVTACTVKNSIFAHIFDREQPIWFVFTEELLEGSAGPHGPFPAEAPSMWDQTGLLPRNLKELAQYRDIEKIDPYLLEGPVYRQWILSVRAGQIDVDAIHRACARWGPKNPGPCLRARLFYLQPGVPVVALPNELEGAMVLLARHQGVLRPYAQLFQAFLRASPPELAAPRTAAIPDIGLAPPDGQVWRVRQRARGNVSALRDHDSPPVADPPMAGGASQDAGAWADRGYGYALEILDGTQPLPGESVRDYLVRVVDQVRTLREEYRGHPESEAMRPCTEALDESMWAIYDAWEEEEKG